MTITVSVQKDWSAGVEGEARDIYKPVKPRQEEPAPPVPGSSRSSGFIKGTLAGSVDQVIPTDTSGNRATRSALLTSGLILFMS
jgi:hypothetical protein